MKELIITYIIIVIIQLVYSIYVPVIADEGQIKLGKNIITDPKEEIKIQKFIKGKLDLLMEKANKMNYFDWLEYVKKNSKYEYNGIKLYIFTWINIDNDKMVVVQYPDETLEGLSWIDFLKEHNEHFLNIQYTLSKNVPLIMYTNSNEGRYDTSGYYWVDPLYQQSVRKKSVFTKFSFKKEDISGLIGMGYNMENLTIKNEFKRFSYISKPELIMGSLITIIISLVISKLNTVKYVKLKAFVFLILINIYIFIFINTHGSIGKTADENEKITNVNAGILNLSFLSTVNLFILNTLYSSNKDLFVETSVIFGMTVFLLLLATYKSTDQNSIYDLIKARLTNTFIFNYAAILNILIMSNFIFHTFSKSFK